MLSININGINWPQQAAGTLEIHVPSEQTGLQESIHGTLKISPEGFVYSLSSKPVLWLKFLGLSAYLSFWSTTLACKIASQKFFGQKIAKNDIIEARHLYNLATIAEKALLGSGHKTLYDRVEQFALAEIDFNNPSREDEMRRARSIRLTHGLYIARCLQPLFHKEQWVNPTVLATQIDNLQKEKDNLIQARIQSKTSKPAYELLGFISFSTSNLDPYEIEERLATVNAQLDGKKNQLHMSERCHKYATAAILSQQWCITQACKNTTVETQVEVECCNMMCYKQQKICGILYKIDCLAMRCWALHFQCCLCCLWPIGRSITIIS